ncbi:ABC transporter ATP-binding protein [Flavobacteriales bacterium]|nr:ABC transporter ATP-binding protein [Flavobacteriales bacterium]
MLKVNKLHIGYNELPLFKKSLTKEWKIGSVVVLLGDNGVGKSTFLKTLSGLHNPVSGEVFREDAIIGWVDSSISKGTYLSVMDFLSFGLDSSHEEKEFWLSKFNLTLAFNCFLDEISDGQFRKLCLIRQLLKKPTILFLDEPTVYLDIKSKLNLSEILNELKSSCLIFCSTHDLHFSEKIQTETLRF